MDEFDLQSEILSIIRRVAVADPKRGWPDALDKEIRDEVMALPIADKSTFLNAVESAGLDRTELVDFFIATKREAEKSGAGEKPDSKTTRGVSDGQTVPGSEDSGRTVVHTGEKRDRVHQEARGAHGVNPDASRVEQVLEGCPVQNGSGAGRILPGQGRSGGGSKPVNSAGKSATDGTSRPVKAGKEKLKPAKPADTLQGSLL